MKNIFNQIRWIPEGYIVAKETPLAIVYRHPTKLQAIAYKAKSNKKVWYYSFLKQEDMDKRINDLFKSVENWEQRKKEHRKEKKIAKAQAREQLKIGDIFHSSWGYEQTNCDYYQITRIEGNFMYLRSIGRKMTGTEGGNGMSGYMLPVKDAFLADEPEFKKVISFYPRLESYESVSLWDGRENYGSWNA